MPNQFLKAETIARTALGLLQRELILPRLVTRMGIAEFRGSKNDTVNIRVPAILTAREYEWRTRNNPIVLDELEELSIPITLNKHPYSAVAVTDEELTLDISSFGAQVLTPQIRAVAEKLEGYVATAMVSAPYPTTHVIDWDDFTDGHSALVEARRLLNNRNVPLAGRVAVLGSRLEADILNEDLFKRVDASGTDDALREARIGRVAGFTVVSGMNSIPEWEGYAFHSSAYVLAAGAPVIPDGATYGSSQTYEGLAMRWLRDYDPSYLRDRSVVSAFAGTGWVNDGLESDGATYQNKVVRAVKIEMGRS